jgi:tetratricopeptide (TPR) repeat protein
VERSLELSPGQSFTYSVRGELLYALGRHAEAAASFSRVRLSLEPRVEDASVPGDLYMTVERRAYKLGCCHLALAAWEEAARCFTEGLRHNPDDAGCMLGMAHVLRARGDLPRALALLRLCLRKDPLWRTPREALAQWSG